MATDSFNLLIGRVPCGCRGLAGAGLVHLPMAGGVRSIGVSCKARNQNLRRHQNKKVSPKRSPLNMNFQPRDVETKEVKNVTKDKNIDAPLGTLSNSIADTCSDTKAGATQTSAGEKVIQPHDDESEEVQNVTTDHIIDAPLDTLSSSMADDTSSITKADETLSSAGEQIILINNTDGGGAGGDDEKGGHGGGDGGHPCRNVRPEDLINMIKNAEKNILLLNQARVRALEDLEKSLSEKEALQAQINGLEMKLAETDARIKVAVTEKESVKEFQDSFNKLEGGKRKALGEPADDMPWEFWSRLLLTIDSWLLEKKISPSDAKLLREMAWKRDGRIRDTYLACKGKNEQDAVAMFLKLILSPTRRGLNIVHIAAEMAPVAKVGGLGDVVSGLGKALQRKGHLVEIILPKYDCMQHEHVTDLKALDVNIESYFDGRLHKNKIWVGTVEGLPVYFVEPHHPAKFFWRGQFYGEHDDFKRFSFFSRAALEFLNQAGKRPDIIHCHDWQTAFVAPLYWDVYKYLGFNSARLCFTCHNFEYQGTTTASELSSCGLDVPRLKRPDRMEDNSAHDKVNPIKGAVVYSNIVTTVSPTYAQEVLTAEGGRGLHETLKYHSQKFVGILNGIDTDVWNPSTDAFLRFQYSADDLQGKAENKDALKRQLKLSSSEPFQPLVGCITRLVPQKGVHLIRHAIYRTLELGGQFVLLGSSPVPHIQSEFEDIAKHFQSHPHIRLVLKYDEVLSHSIYAASDMFIVPSIFEPCGLTQMIAMRYGSVPIVRRTGGLNDSVFDVDDDSVPFKYRNGFTFLAPNEQELNDAMERAFSCYMKRREIWQALVQKDMRIDFGWDSSAAQYEELYENALARARAASESQ